MYAIHKQFRFAASHSIKGLPEGHKCGRLHGHSYKVEVELRAPELDPVGFVVDFGELSHFKHYLDQVFDHRHLNDVMGHDQTTAENLAKFLYDWCKAKWPQTYRIQVWETPESPIASAEYWT